MFTVGRRYTRTEIYNLLTLDESQRGGDWLNGYHRHGSGYYIFCNIGIPGRTGHDYNNHWEGDTLVWFGKTMSHFGQSAIKNLASGKYRVFVFHRGDDRAPFTFAGEAEPIPHRNTKHPARIDWVFSSIKIQSDHGNIFPDELPTNVVYLEGQRTQVYVNRYERDPRARAACIRHHGYNCVACGMNFHQIYGELGTDFIHVHHLKPLNELGRSYVIDPINDLIPVCPNCHAMLHRSSSVIDITALQKLISKQRDRQ